MAFQPFWLLLTVNEKRYSEISIVVTLEVLIRTPFVNDNEKSETFLAASWLCNKLTMDAKKIWISYPLVNFRGCPGFHSSSTAAVPAALVLLVSYYKYPFYYKNPFQKM